MREVSEMSKGIYSRPVAFALLATLVILVGTLVTTFVPLASESMHPKLENLRPFSPMELAGRDIYQREGCVNCHTQTVRPLKTEVMRYGEYSKAGEFAYDRPFLWGSKRTGPDLARVGQRLPAKVHYMHFKDPTSTVPRSNMPVYGWLADNELDADEVRAHMDALDLPYVQADLDELKGRNELDALVAYMLSLGHAVRKGQTASEEHEMSLGEALYADNCAGCHGEDRSGGYAPSLLDISLTQAELKDLLVKGTEGGMPGFEGVLSGVEMDAVSDFLLGGAHDTGAATEGPGAGLYVSNCAGCHDVDGSGGFGPSLRDNTWLGKEGPIDDAGMRDIILNGTSKGMPPWKGTLSDTDIDAIVAHIRALGK